MKWYENKVNDDIRADTQNQEVQEISDFPGGRLEISDFPGGRLENQKLNA